jgi:hypothetical protein
LVLRHQMRVSNYFVNSFYSVQSYSGRHAVILTRQKITKIRTFLLSQFKPLKPMKYQTIF